MSKSATFTHQSPNPHIVPQNRQGRFGTRDQPSLEQRTSPLRNKPYPWNMTLPEALQDPCLLCDGTRSSHTSCLSRLRDKLHVERPKRRVSTEPSIEISRQSQLQVGPSLYLPMLGLLSPHFVCRALVFKPPRTRHPFELGKTRDRRKISNFSKPPGNSFLRMAKVAKAKIPYSRISAGRTPHVLLNKCTGLCLYFICTEMYTSHTFKQSTSEIL